MTQHPYNDHSCKEKPVSSNARKQASWFIHFPVLLLRFDKYYVQPSGPSPLPFAEISHARLLAEHSK